MEGNETCHVEMKQVFRSMCSKAYSAVHQCMDTHVGKAPADGEGAQRLVGPRKMTPYKDVSDMLLYYT
eukprot:1036645-Prymnesium_polylepis.1